ncbi:MAG: metallophosphoesterase, partial [Cyanobacteria bacterium J06639_1]
ANWSFVSLVPESRFFGNEPCRRAIRAGKQSSAYHFGDRTPPKGDRPLLASSLRAETVDNRIWLLSCLQVLPVPLDFRFAIASDLHIALPHTILDRPGRFHMVELSVAAFEATLHHWETLDLDFALLPGDLTQDGELDNHSWLRERLSRLPFPVYVIPGNHDVLHRNSTHSVMGLNDFASHYRDFGPDDRPYYTRCLLPGVRLIALNSNDFDSSDRQYGRLDEVQLDWLRQVLDETRDEFVIVMVHHNAIEHLPDQSRHPLGRRYMLDNAPVLLELLEAAGVNLILTGHLHVQDIARTGNIYEITTGSLVSYPHPYRVVQVSAGDRLTLQIESHRIEALPNWPNLQHYSRNFMGDRSLSFVLKLLTDEPLNLEETVARSLAPHLRYFWADIAGGDTKFDLPHLPAAVQRYFETFDDPPFPADNRETLAIDLKR